MQNQANVIRVWRAEDAPTAVQFAVDRYMADWVAQVPPSAGEWTEDGWKWGDDWYHTQDLLCDGNWPKLRAENGGLIIMGGGYDDRDA